MANEEHLEILRKGVKAWNKWREQIPDVRPDLSRANLTGAGLSGADLIEANLIWADLSWANLIGAYLSGAKLSHAHLSGGDLRRADLSGGDLRRADLRRADLSEADLRWTNLNAANLSEANLSKAEAGSTHFSNIDLSKARGLDELKHGGPSSVDHQTLEQSDPLPDAFLRGVGFSDTFIEYYPSIYGGNAIDYYSCFISYSHEDKSFARRLHDALQGRGIRCWLDEKQLLPGDDIYEQVDRGIKLWDKVLLCCSRSSLTSWWVDNEINAAFKKEQQIMKQRDKKALALIPLNLDGWMFENDWGGGKKDQVCSRLAANFTGWESDNAKFEDQFELVVRALQTGESGRETPPKQKI